MSRLFAKQALLPTGWESDVALSIDARGIIDSVEHNASVGNDKAVGVVIPGMPNLHSHAFQRALAGAAEYSTVATDTFWTWRKLMYRLAEQISAPQMEVIATHLYVEMVKTGYTSVAEFHYLHGHNEGEDIVGLTMAETLMRAAEKAGIGLTLLPVLYQRGGFGDEPLSKEQRRFCLSTEDYIALYHSLLGQISQKSNQRLGLAFHSLRAVSDDAISEVLKGIEAIDKGAPRHIHVAEQVREVEDCLQSTGQRPVEHLATLTALDERWCLIHATHVSNEELGQMAESKVVVGLCPSTEANLADGIFPLKAYLDARGQFGIGSDSHVSVNPLEELRWLEYGQRLVTGERLVAADSDGAHCGHFLWQRALLGGAQALGQSVGAIAPGKRADLLVLDGSNPFLAERKGPALLDGLIFAAGVNAISDVMIGGRWVVQDGSHALDAEGHGDFIGLLRTLHLLDAS